VPEPEQPGEEFDPRGRGTFWHRVLEELFQRLKAAGLLGKDIQDVPDALLEESLKAAVQKFEERYHVGHPALWRLHVERARGMARRILSDERRGLPFSRLEPTGFELRFGPRAQEDNWSQVVLSLGEEDIHFEGSIDRLDMGGGQVGVIDYKSGRIDKKGLREKLLSSDFQLPLYLYAVRASGHREARNAAWFSLRTGEIIELASLLSAEELEDLLSTDPAVRGRLEQENGLNLANAVERMVRTLRSGQFAPRPKDCGNCGYRPVCRITERRLVDEEHAHE